MPRKARIESAGKHYVFNRARDNRPIFKTAEQKKDFLNIVCAGCTRYDATVIAFTILDTEYHLLIETTKPNLSLLMRQISAGYSISFNKSVKSRGNIWHDRFASWVISGKEDVLFLQKFMAHCPVLKNYVKKPGEYQFSSIKTLLDGEMSIGCFHNILKIKKIKEIQKSSFGDAELTLLQNIKRRARQADKAVSAPEAREPIEKIFKKIKNREKRNKKIVAAFQAGYSQNEIALFLELSQSSISKIINASGRI